MIRGTHSSGSHQRDAPYTQHAIGHESSPEGHFGNWTRFTIAVTTNTDLSSKGTLRTELHIILEQAPDPESRVVLSSEKTRRTGNAGIPDPLESYGSRTADGGTQRSTIISGVRAVGTTDAEPDGAPPVSSPTGFPTAPNKPIRPALPRMSDNPKEGVVDRPLPSARK